MPTLLVYIPACNGVGPECGNVNPSSYALASKNLSPDMLRGAGSFASQGKANGEASAIAWHQLPSMWAQSWLEKPRADKFIDVVGSLVAAPEKSAAELGGFVFAGAIKYGKGLLDDVAKGSPRRADFVVGPSGTAIPTSKIRLQEGFKRAELESYPNKKSAEAGTIYRDPNSGNMYRVMEGSDAHPPRLMTHAPGGNPLLPDGGNIPPGLSRDQIRDLTHFRLKP